jgi:hypothetical protein
MGGGVVGSGEGEGAGITRGGGEILGRGLGLTVAGLAGVIDASGLGCPGIGSEAPQLSDAASSPVKSSEKIEKPVPGRTDLS